MLDDTEVAALAEAWILAQHTDRKAPEYEERFWAIDWMFELPRKHPQDCWAVILAIFDRDRSDRILSFLAAGPLEQLLAHRGGDSSMPSSSAPAGAPTFAAC